MGAIQLGFDRFISSPAAAQRQQKQQKRNCTYLVGVESAIRVRCLRRILEHILVQNSSLMFCSELDNYMITRRYKKFLRHLYKKSGYVRKLHQRWQET